MSEFIGLGLGLTLFIIAIIAYSLGVKHGRQMSQGIIPKISLNPVKAVTQALEVHEQKKEAEKVTDELADIMNYTKETALSAVKKER